MAQIYPFTRANSVNFVDGNVFTGAQATTIDKNAAQAADGLFWSDVAAVRTWPYDTVITGARTIVQGIRSGSGTQNLMWMVTGTSDLYRLSMGGKVWEGTTIAALPTTPMCSASNGLGLVFGGDNGASTQKYAYSTTGTNGTFNAGTSADNTTATVGAMVWIAGSVNLFVAGLSDGGIETSPTGQTWTDRTVPNANTRTSMATNGTDLIVACTSASTDKYITSANGTSWTERSFPASSTVWQIVYSPYWNKWYASNVSGTAMYKSSDAINWTSVALTGNDGPMVATGRLLLMATTGDIVGSTNINILVSADEGATWHSGVVIAGTSGVVRSFVKGYRNNQVAIVTDAGNVALSMPMADPTDATYI